MMQRVEIEEVVKNIPNIKIIDIRDNYKFNMGNIPTSENVPMNFLIMNPSNYLEKGDKYYIYCEHGERSLRTCSILTKMGYDVVDISGGYEEYRAFQLKKKL